MRDLFQQLIVGLAVGLAAVLIVYLDCLRFRARLRKLEQKRKDACEKGIEEARRG